jgi:hypothetical protein
MLSKIQTFLWKHRGKLISTFMVTLVGIPILFGGAFFLLQHTQTVGYLISQEEETVKVTAKETKDLQRRRCTVPGPNGGCAAYEIITNTLYIIVTPTETFFTEAELYHQFEIGREYPVILTGWHNSALPPRRISKVIKEE